MTYKTKQNSLEAKITKLKIELKKLSKSVKHTSETPSPTTKEFQSKQNSLDKS